MQRFYLALYATMPAALTAAALMHLCPPAGLPSLAQRPTWPIWALIRKHLASAARVELEAAMGALERAHDPLQQGLGALLDSLRELLHFGDFGILAFKCLYFIQGLTPALSSITATLIRIDPRQQRQRNAQAPITNAAP